MHSPKLYTFDQLDCSGRRTRCTSWGGGSGGWLLIEHINIWKILILGGGRAVCQGADQEAQGEEREEEAEEQVQESWLLTPGESSFYWSGRGDGRGRWGPLTLGLLLGLGLGLVWALQRRGQGRAQRPAWLDTSGDLREGFKKVKWSTFGE